MATPSPWGEGRDEGGRESFFYAIERAVSAPQTLREVGAGCYWQNPPTERQESGGPTTRVPLPFTHKRASRFITERELHPACGF